MTTRLGQNRLLRRGALAVRAGFRALQGEWLAGGPLEIEFTAAPLAGGPLHLLGGVDRATLRPLWFSFTATVGGSRQPLGDPLDDVVALGGPVGASPIEAGAIHRQTLLVNEYAALEEVPARLPPGGLGELRLRCRRPLPLALTPAEAFAITDESPVLEARLVVPARRDDRALDALAAELGEQIRGHHAAADPAATKRAIDQLANLRTASSRAELQRLRRHRDPWLRLRLALALRGA